MRFHLKIFTRSLKYHHKLNIWNVNVPFNQQLHNFRPQNQNCKNQHTTNDVYDVYKEVLPFTKVIHTINNICYPRKVHDDQKSHANYVTIFKDIQKLNLLKKNNVNAMSNNQPLLDPFPFDVASMCRWFTPNFFFNSINVPCDEYKKRNISNNYTNNWH